MKLTVSKESKYIKASDAKQYNYYISSTTPHILRQYVCYSDLDSNHDHPYGFLTVATKSLDFFSSSWEIIPVEIVAVEVKILAS